MILYSSCATKKDYIFDDEESIVETTTLFDLSHDERFQQFKVETAKTEREDLLEEESDKLGPLKVETTPNKTETKEKIEPKLGPLDSGDSKQVDIVETIEKPALVSVPVLPEEYPEEFLKYDERSKKIWDKFSPNTYENEKFVFRISYLGLTAGNVQLTTEPLAKIGDREVFHFRAHLRSARYYRMIYQLDDRLETFIDAESFLPVKYVLIQRESGQNVDDLQFFDSEKLQTHFFFKREREDSLSEREETHFTPYFIQDSFSPLHFVRGLPLNIGDRYEFPVVTRGRIWLIELNVEREESIRVMGRWTNAVRVNAITRFPGVLEKRGDIVFWYSADEYRRPLQFQADVRIGSIRGELVEYTPGTKVQRPRSH